MVFTLLMYVVILSMLFGGLCCICGEQRKGSQILVNSVTALVLYMIIAQLACSGLPAGSSFSHGLPFINHIRQAGGIKFLLSDSPGIFARDFVELVTLILLIQWTASLVSFSDAGFVGKITAGIVIVFIPAKQRAKRELARIWRLPRGSKTPLLCSVSCLMPHCLQRGL